MLKEYFIKSQKISQLLEDIGQEFGANQNKNSVSKTPGQVRPLYQIAQEIKQDWKNVNYAAKPYLEAMSELDKITDNYMMDSGESVVLYFLSNASQWKGEKAKQIKAELKKMAGIK